MFVCIEMLINCGFILIIRRFFFNESISSCSIHVHSLSGTNDSNCQTHSPLSFDSSTNEGLNVLIRQPHTILYLQRKRTCHNVINHMRALGFGWCHGQLQKALLINFYSVCVDFVCEIFEDLIRYRCWFSLFKVAPHPFHLAIKVNA